MVHAGCRGRERDGAGREERDVCSTRGVVESHGWQKRGMRRSCHGAMPRCRGQAMPPVDRERLLSAGRDRRARGHSPGLIPLPLAAAAAAPIFLSLRPVSCLPPSGFYLHCQSFFFQPAKRNGNSDPRPCCSLIAPTNAPSICVVWLYQLSPGKIWPITQAICRNVGQSLQCHCAFFLSSVSLFYRSFWLAKYHKF